MKKWLKEKIAVVSALVMIAALLAGCGGGSSNSLLFTYNNEKVYMNEAWLYAIQAQNYYETYYGPDIWSYEMPDEAGNVQTFEALVKRDIIDQIKMSKLLSAKAKEAELTLTDDEVKEVEDNAKSYMDELSDEDKARTGITEELMVKYLQENKLSQKMYDKIVEDGNLEVSDEEAVKMNTYNLLFETFTTDEEGTEQQMTAKQKAQQKKKAEEALAKLKDGADIEKLAEEYQTENSSEFVFGKADSVVDEYREAAEKLKDGEISDIVESQFGYHIILMRSTNDTEASETYKEQLLSEKQAEYFQAEYEKMAAELEEGWDFDNDVNQKAFESITFVKAADDASTGDEGSTDQDTSEEGTTAS